MGDSENDNFVGEFPHDNVVWKALENYPFGAA